MRRAVVSAVSVLFLALVACASDDDADTASTTSPPTSEATTTSTTEATTTTTALLSPAPSAAEAAARFLAVWQAGDRVAAAAIAETDAVESMFAVPVAPPEDRGCNEPPAGVASATHCVYRVGGVEVQLRMEETAPGAWIVTAATHD